MSYLVNASGEYLEGTFASQYAVDASNAITIAAWCKKSNWGGGTYGILDIEEVSGTQDPGIRIVGQGGNDKFRARSYDNAGEEKAVFTAGTDEYDGVWVCIVGVFGSNTSRDIFVEDSTNTDNDTADATLDAGDVVRMGNYNKTNGYLDGRIAEVCIWNIALSDANIDALQTGAGAGPAPNTIASANVIGYWTLAADGGAGITNGGSDSGADMTVTNATYDADHPTIATDSISDINYHGMSRGVMRGTGRGVG